MDAKHRTVQILGVAALVAGSLYGLLVLSGLPALRFSDIWGLLNRVFGLAIAAYLVWAAMRMMRWAKGLPSLQTNRVKWGRVLLGSLLAYNSLRTHLHPAPAPELLQPSNPTQATAMHATYFIILALGVGLALSGILSGFRKPTSGDQSAQ